MEADLFDPHVLNVIKSFRPFMGVKGSNCVLTLENLLELLSCEQAKNTIAALKMLSSGKDVQALDQQTADINSNPYSLFLILILLLLSGGSSNDGDGSLVQGEKEIQNGEESDFSG